MTHIDEGTIHAWLDDALPPDEAARVEAHVRDCAECSAAVAEARGFIAASSRILSALDDVPAGVIPRPEGDAGRVKPKVVHPEVVKSGATHARRRWWLSPQFAAAAGIAFIAVALSVVARRDGVRSVADYSLERAPANEAQGAATPVAPDAPAPAPAARESAIADTAVRGVATPPNAAAATPPNAAAATPPKAAAAPSPQAAVAGGTARPVDSTAAKRTLTVSPDAITRTEKARVAGERTVQQEAVVATGAAATRSDTRRDATTLQGIVGCYRLQRRVPALDAGVTEIVALEETETGRHEDAVLRSARLIGARSEADTHWHWTLSPKGDVALVREQAGAYVRFPLALRPAAQTEETSIATRVDCPAR